MSASHDPAAGDDAIVDRLAEDGVAVLPQPLPPAFVADLRSAFLPLLERYVDRHDPNRGIRRHQMYLPFEPPFSDAALWGDPTVLRVVERVLGSDAECTYYGSDTPLGGSDHQPTHQDGGPLFPKWSPRPPPYCLALNVPLVDVDEHNGPLEWFDGHDEPAPATRPNRFTGPAGSMLLRDTRVWHRGSPNTGDSPRPMLALLYTRSWYRFPLDRPMIDRSVYEALPDRGRRLFRGADIVPPKRADGDRLRLAREPA